MVDKYNTFLYDIGCGGTFMRKDVMEAVNARKKDGIKPNYSELARIYNCDYRIVKRYYENDIHDRKKTVKPSMLDEYKEFINEKVDAGYQAKAIFDYLVKEGFKGKYGIVQKYVREYKLGQLK